MGIAFISIGFLTAGASVGLGIFIIVLGLVGHDAARQSQVVLLAVPHIRMDKESQLAVPTIYDDKHQYHKMRSAISRDGSDDRRMSTDRGCPSRAFSSKHARSTTRRVRMNGKGRREEVSAYQISGAPNRRSRLALRSAGNSLGPSARPWRIGRTWPTWHRNLGPGGRGAEARCQSACLHNRWDRRHRAPVCPRARPDRQPMPWAKPTAGGPALTGNR